MNETIEAVKKERERELQFKEGSSSRKRCHNSTLHKSTELSDSLEREHNSSELEFVNDGKKRVNKIYYRELKRKMDCYVKETKTLRNSLSFL